MNTHETGLNGSMVPHLLLRLLDHSTAAAVQLSRIEDRLVAGDERMTTLETSVEAVKGAVTSTTARLERAEKMARAPRWERHAKRVFRYALLGGVAYGTGSVEAALKLMEAVK